MNPIQRIEILENQTPYGLIDLFPKVANHHYNHFFSELEKEYADDFASKVILL